jgi:hypothetical protein
VALAVAAHGIRSGIATSSATCQPICADRYSAPRSRDFYGVPAPFSLPTEGRKLIHYATFSCRTLLAVVFCVAAITKMRRKSDLVQFRATIAAFGIGFRWTSTAAGAVIAGELTAASLILIDATALGGLALAAGLLAIFTVMIRLTARRGVAMSCRCFGASDQPLGVRHVVRNTILLSITAVGVAGTLITPSGADRLDVAALILSGFVGVVLAALVVAYDDLVALMRVR